MIVPTVGADEPVKAEVADATVLGALAAPA